jgi:Flp pilus assembly pilin Flp
VTYPSWLGVVAAIHKVIGREEEGASLVEYAFLLVLVLVVALVAMQFVGNATANSINSSGSSLFNP